MCLKHSLMLSLCSRTLWCYNQSPCHTMSRCCRRSPRTATGRCSQFPVCRCLLSTAHTAPARSRSSELILTSAWKSSIRRFVITEKAPTRAFSWLKAATTAFTFKTLLRHYAKWTLTPRSLNVKLGDYTTGCGTDGSFYSTFDNSSCNGAGNHDHSNYSTAACGVLPVSLIQTSYQSRYFIECSPISTSICLI